MCKCKGKCGCNISTITKGEKGDPSSASSLGYKVYTAFLNQKGTSAPIATVLKNTIGAIVWTRSNTGYYLATLFGAFPTNKTMILSPQSVSTPNLSPSKGNFDCYSVGLDSNNDVFLATANVAVGSSDIVRQDNLLYGDGFSAIEIRVYS